MTESRRGPVLAYPQTAPVRSTTASTQAAVETLLAGHDLRLVVVDGPAPGVPALRVVESRTGQPPLRIPEAVTSQLAAWVAGCDSSAVA